MTINDAKMAEKELKVGMLTKRSQQKKSIGPINYKERVFVLTNQKLSYYEGDMHNRGKLKGTVNINAIKFIGPIDDKALNKPNSFQIVHKEYILYCTARHQNERDEWLDCLKKVCTNTLKEQYHSQTFSGKSWQCCGKHGKDAGGCKRLSKSFSPPNLSLPNPPLPSYNLPYASQTNRNLIPESYNTHSLSTVEAHKFTSVNYNFHQPTQEASPPVPPPGNKPLATFDYKYTVMAMYNFQPHELEDIKLVQGRIYYVLDDSKEHWWRVRDECNLEGNAPSNFVKKVTDDENDINNMPWFQSNLSRIDSENILIAEGKEGCFVVRKSSQQDATYTLSIASRGGKMHGKFSVRHYHIKQGEDGLFYLSDKHLLPNVVKLIEYHRHNAGGLVTRLKNPPQQFLGDIPLHTFGDGTFEINLNDLQLLDELGSGQFGVVRLAKWKGRRKVAVKMMKEGAMEEDSFIEEAEVMTKLIHPYLVKLYGVVTRQRPICIVTEFMENGCLLDYVRNNHELRYQSNVLLNMCLQVCDAMKYLEENNLIHRDLAARNCLVGKDATVKVSDFGLTRFVPDDEYTTSTGSKFPIKWASPEVLQYARFSSKSDMWAFGVLMWELYSGGKMPYVAWSNAEVAEKVVDGYKLEKPNYCQGDVYNIMTQTWEFEPEERPTFSKLYNSLLSMIK